MDNREVITNSLPTNREPGFGTQDNEAQEGAYTPKPVTNVAHNDIGPEETKALNYIIETLAPKIESGNIIDISKLKKAILDKYGQLPTKAISSGVCATYICDELGLDAISTENTFIKGLK